VCYFHAYIQERKRERDKEDVNEIKTKTIGAANTNKYTEQRSHSLDDIGVDNTVAISIK